MASNSKTINLYCNNRPTSVPFTLTVSFNEDSTSVSSNTSNITCSATLKANGSYWATSYNSTIDIYWYDNRTGYQTHVKSYQFAGLDNEWDSRSTSVNFNVEHNSDGTLSGYARAVFTKGNTTTDWACNSGEVSTDMTTLTTIARASGVSCSSPYIGDTATITIDRKSSNFTHTVWYVFGSVRNTIATKTSSTVLSFDTNAVKSQLYSQIPNARNGAGTMYCETFNGNTSIGTKSCGFNLYAKENECKPTVSGTVIDTNQDTINLTGDSNKIVKNASKPKVTVSASSKYSSSISSYSINLNDGQTSNSREHTFNTINSNSITVSATDSRGYSSSSTISLSGRIIDYVKLGFSTIDLRRTEGTSSEVILNANGNYYNGNFGASQTLRNIIVGDNLSGKTLYFDIPENEYLEIPNHLARDDENFVIVCDYLNNYIMETFTSSHYAESGGLYSYHNGTRDTTIYEKSTESGTGEEIVHSYINLSQITLPNDFGTVISVNDDTAMYEHIYIQDNTPNRLTCSYMYKESGTESWINGGTLIPTITNNTFRFTNISLGNNFDYEKEYQFKVIASDLLMTIGNDNSNIIVVPKGQEALAIGEDSTWIYGNCYLNDRNILDLIYPVGSIYLSVNSTNPATIYGGSWQRIENVFLVGAGSSYGAGSTGGSSTHYHSTGNHTLTVDEIPSHRHYISGRNNTYGAGVQPDWVSIASVGSNKADYSYDNYTSYTGGSGAHNHGNTGSSSNLPPYLSVYMWKRTA